MDGSKLESLIENLANEPTSEERMKVAEMCRRVVEKILGWAEKNDIDISSIKKLGGGFVNVVLLIQTIDGKEYVAKSFSQKEDAITSRNAQRLIDRIADEDISFIPEVVSWIDEDLVVSEKADGFPVRKILLGAKEGDIEDSHIHEAFSSLGRAIGALHERTQSHSGNIQYTGDVDPKKITKELMRPDLMKAVDPSIDNETIEKAISSVEELTDFKHLSIVHGDAHLDQFFFTPDDSVVTIVDYDSLRIGDPMFDVARSIASIRSWCHRMNLSDEIESSVIQSLLNGYRESREESSIFDEQEFSYKRVIAYEMKLYLVQLKNLIEKKVSEDAEEYQFVTRSIRDCIQYLVKMK